MLIQCLQPDSPRVLHQSHSLSYGSNYRSLLNVACFGILGITPQTGHQGPVWYVFFSGIIEAETSQCFESACLGKPDRSENGTINSTLTPMCLAASAARFTALYQSEDLHRSFPVGGCAWQYPTFFSFRQASMASLHSKEPALNSHWGQ